MNKSGAKTPLMGGQACVFYGGAEFSCDLDLLILADTANLERLRIFAAPVAAAQARAGAAPSPAPKSKVVELRAQRIHVR
jgi:hypothetical protein